MKSINILISNKDTREMIELCLESILRYTASPSIMVYDDGSTNGRDLAYLRKARQNGLIRLMEGDRNRGHGHALNKLIKACDADFAAILDSDIQILQGGWLEEFVSLIKDDRDLLVTGIEGNLQVERPCITTWFHSWFMLLNMRAYKDGMCVDWRQGVENGLYHPVGARLWLKVQNDNPKGYRIIEGIPKSLQAKYHHHIHISCIATPDPSDPPEFRKAREVKMGRIREELKKLRAG